MALRDQPYIPLYVKDVLTDEKLIECSAAAHGVYFRLLCVLHKQKTYGKLKLMPPYKISQEPVECYTEMLAKQMPFPKQIINLGLTELLAHEVIKLEGDYLSQKRMVNDNSLSVKRAKAGKKGGRKTAAEFAQANAEAKNQANTVNANATVIGSVLFEKNKSELLADQIFHEQVCMAFSLEMPFMLERLNEFINMKAIGDELEKPLPECQRHFRNWLKIDLVKNPSPEKKLFTQRMVI